jgi:hypothetical protein
MKNLYVLWPICVVILSGCATLNKNECLTADWYQIGYEDGAQGHPDSRIALHRKACAAYDITPDFRDYQDGYNEGVIRFCTASNGFAQGKRGYDYSGICPSGLEASFLHGYEAGKQIYSVSSMIRSLDSEQQKNHSRIETLQAQIIDKTHLMLADSTAIAERYRLNAEIAQMQQDLGALKERNQQIITEIAEAQAKLQVLERKYRHY